MLAMTLPAPLAPFGAYNQWIVYYLRPKPDKPGKTDKVPVHHATGWRCSLTAADSWTTYEAACAAASRLAAMPATSWPNDGGGCDERHAYGVGFVFTKADPFWFLDVDGALVDGKWSPVALDLIASLPGAAWEISQSGTGLHAFGTGEYPADRKVKNTTYGVELYHHDRFVALTRNTWTTAGSAAAHVPQIAQVAVRYLEQRNDDGDAPGWTTTPFEGWDASLADDEELIRRMLASKSLNDVLGSRDGGGPRWTVQQLWAGTDVPEDLQSEADGALAAHLAFWTGKNCERVEALMQRSGLLRPKWHTSRPIYGTYLRTTIVNAVGAVANIAKPRPVQQVQDDGTLAVVEEAYGAYVSAFQMPAFFKGCAYIIDANKVFTKRYGMLSATAFDTTFGGHAFPLDDEGRKVTASAWEAFRMHQMWRPPIADSVCFRPELPTGQMVSYEGRQLLNSYVPIDTVKVDGDPSRFIEFMKRILPIETDRLIALSYMAAMVQNPGRKFQWWLVIQGAEGNGKTLLLRCLSHAIGHRYTHLVNPEAMAKTGNQFNSWIEGHLFVGIEEIYMSKRRDFLETFKSTVTNDRIGIEGKGLAQRTGDNRANGLMLTNHKEAIPVTVDSRRYAILYCAQQSEFDLRRDNMHGSYFPDLYNWLLGRDEYAGLGENYGYAVVAHYLANYTPDPRFNPAGLCQRAPHSSSFGEALQQSLGRAEQEIQEAIEEGRPGFCGGWVSSHYLDLLLDRIRAAVPRNKRRQLMQSIGYDWHPALGDSGRVHNIVLPDGNKPRLYVRKDSSALALSSAADVARMYGAAQMPMTQAMVGDPTPVYS